MSSYHHVHRYRYVDTHCHVDLFKNPGATLRAAAAQSVLVVAMTNAPSVFAATAQICREHDNAIPALGLHPELAHERSSELALFDTHIDSASILGEIGLDRIRTSPQATAQRNVFRKVLSMATGRGKVLSIHSRGASDEVVELLGSSYVGSVILHWYTGTLKTASMAMKAGYFFSFNRLMIRSASGRTLLARVPRGLILTETDAPFAHLQGESNQPHDVPMLITEIAGILDVQPEAMQQQVHANFCRALFGRE